MRFAVADEARLFGESVRAVVADWRPVGDPEVGEWQDDRDDDLAVRLVEAGWSQLWTSADLLGPVVAGGLELGRAVTPVCLIDEATLGAPLAVGGRARHGRHSPSFAVPLPGGGLAIGSSGSEARPETTLDASGTVGVEVVPGGELEAVAASACWRAWSAATLAYFAGLAGRALELTVEHARAREQFGAPLAALPAVRSRLADATLTVDSLRLLAWAAASDGRSLPTPELLWAGSVCCDVTASAHQVHGAVGFALETGLHRYYRRARAVQAWTAAACQAAR